jgi:hypothetical protein
VQITRVSGASGLHNGAAAACNHHFFSISRHKTLTEVISGFYLLESVLFVQSPMLYNKPELLALKTCETRSRITRAAAGQLLQKRQAKSQTSIVKRRFSAPVIIFPLSASFPKACNTA